MAKKMIFILDFQINEKVAYNKMKKIFTYTYYLTRKKSYLPKNSYNKFQKSLHLHRYTFILNYTSIQSR